MEGTRKCVRNMCFSFYFHWFQLIYKIISPFHFVFCYFLVPTYLISQNWLSSLFFLFACLCTWCKFLYLWCYFSSMSANTRSRFILCSTSSPRSEPGTGRTWWCLDCGRMRCSTRSANPICDFMLWSIFFFFCHTWDDNNKLLHGSLLTLFVPYNWFVDLLQPLCPKELWHFVHQCYGNELGLTSDDEDYVPPDDDFNTMGYVWLWCCISYYGYHYKYCHLVA